MRRLRQVAFVFAMAAMPSFTVAAQEAAPAGQNRFGGPAASPAGVETGAGAGAACDNSVSRKTSGGGRIERYKLAFLYALTEYNTGTCAQIDMGKWTVTGQQKCKTENCGTVTLGKLTDLPLGNGACPGHKYTFSSICYTWNKHIDWKIKDQIDATWKARDFNSPFSFPVNVPIVYPTSETTAFTNVWDVNENGEWKQTLHAKSEPGFDWSQSHVKEIDPGPNDPTRDKCWCKGSKEDPFYKITGGTWPNPVDTIKWPSWGPDHVGMGFRRYRYFRLKQRAPCGTTLPQQMQFQATAVSAEWKDYGSVNTLGGSFNYQDIFSLRAGMSGKKSFEPVPTKLRLKCSMIKWPTVAAAFGASIVVSDPRPVAAAIEEIEKVSGRPITYEDSPILNRYHMTPMVEDTSGNTRLLVPRGGTLRFTLPADGSAEHVIAAVQGMVENYNATHGAATFSVSQDGLTHVVPRQTLDASSRLAPVTPVLDSRITLAAKPRSLFDLLDEICRAVSLVSGQSVDIGTVPTNALYQRQTEIGANNEPARKVLEKLIAASGMPLSWRLLYDPGLKDYALNMPVFQQLSVQP